MVNHHGAGASWVSGPLLSAWRRVPGALRLPHSGLQPATGGKEQGPAELGAPLGRAPFLPQPYIFSAAFCVEAVGGISWRPFPFRRHLHGKTWTLVTWPPRGPWLSCHLTPPSINSSFDILPLHPLGSRPALGQIPVSSGASLEGPLTVLLLRPLPLIFPSRGQLPTLHPGPGGGVAPCTALRATPGHPPFSPVKFACPQTLYPFLLPFTDNRVANLSPPQEGNSFPGAFFRAVLIRMLAEFHRCHVSPSIPSSPPAIGPLLPVPPSRLALNHAAGCLSPPQWQTFYTETASTAFLTRFTILPSRIL